MRTLARSTGVLRMLLIAGVLVFAWLAAAPITATSAFAHAGHRHAPAAPASKAVESEPKPATGRVLRQQPAAPWPLVRSDTPHVKPPPQGRDAANDTLAQGKGALHVRARSVGFEVSDVSPAAAFAGPAPGAKAPCICGFACGACTSMGCCHTGLAPAGHAIVARVREIVRVQPRADRLGGRIVVPLPRPPDV